MISSGDTALATSGDSAITLLTVPAAYRENGVTIINESGIVGFFSTDGGSNWGRWPSGAKSLELDSVGASVKFKRVPSGTDVTGLWAFIN